MKPLCMTTLYGMAAIVTLGCPNAYAQFEADPDH